MKYFFLISIFFSNLVSSQISNLFNVDETYFCFVTNKNNKIIKNPYVIDLKRITWKSDKSKYFYTEDIKRSSRAGSQGTYFHIAKEDISQILLTAFYDEAYGVVMTIAIEKGSQDFKLVTYDHRLPNYVDAETGTCRDT